MPWRITGLIECRREFCELVTVTGMSVKGACREFKISRKTGHKWLNRFRQGGIAGLSDRSRKPQRCPGRACTDLERLVVRYKKRYPYWGPRKIHRLVYKDHPEAEHFSISTVARILSRHGLVIPREPKVVHSTIGCFERSEPNELWQMDLKMALRLPDGTKRYVAGILDDHSRYVLGLWWLDNLTAESVLSCWIAAVRSYGLPRQTLTDHGAQFRMEDHTTSAFRAYLWACGVQHTQGRVAHPQTQGKIERFWRTFQNELTPQLKQVKPAKWERLTEQWLLQYNTLRPHESLDDMTPASRYQPSMCAYVAPDYGARIGRPESVYRRVSPRGIISLGGKLLMIGRGLAKWTVEARPLGNGCWHIYFRNHFLKEFLLSKPKESVTYVPVQVLPIS